MNILPVSNNYSPNFGITSKVRIPMKDGSTTLLNVTGEAKKDGYSVKITKIVGDIMRKGKSIGKTKEYENKTGFSEERFAVISEELGQNAKDPDSVMDKIFDAIKKPNPDYNA
jgi:hypothetical protein